MRRRFAFLLAISAGFAASAMAQQTTPVTPPTAPAENKPMIRAEQQDRIRELVRNAKVDHAAKVRFDLRLGAEVPRNLHFYPLPKEVAEAVPEFSNYFYVVAEEKIVVIDPLKYRIVAIIPA
ncbi:MAG: DUF1236 domain-containing protein [Xanthobacteraceae bacterium]|nr:DUF1236 domain-containing protein [Xanthobacteraceae bacterium]QYK43882.1 MAG: DUF1236 domain-containing protein [Xanthobacteraceae bacterium]